MVEVEFKEKQEGENQFSRKLLAKPVKFNQLFADQDINLVQVHSDFGKVPVGFCGVFSWKDNKITPLDYDSYNPEMLVYGYEWFKSEDSWALEIFVGDDW